MGHQGIDKVYQRILKRFEWPGMNKACEKKITAFLSCQQVKDPRKLRSQEGQLLIPASSLELISSMRSTGTSMDIFVRGVGVIFTHTEKLIIQKLRIARETGDLEAETGEDPKKPDIRRVVESYFTFPNEYSSSIILTDSIFILTSRTCAIAITAVMSFKTALAADFKREYKNIELLWKQRPGIGGVAALPPAASQIPGT